MMGADDWLQELAAAKRDEAKQAGVPVGAREQWTPQMREECRRLEAAYASREDYGDSL